MKIRLRFLSAILLLVTSAAAFAGFTPIPLDAVANRELEDQDDEGLPAGWSGQGSQNSLSGFPRGRADFLGIPFEIPTTGPAAVMLRSTRLSKLPATVTIPVPGVQAQSLYLLCTAIWSKPEALATVTVNYSGGATQAVAISDGDNIQDWWRGDLLPRAVVGWQGKNRRKKPHGLSDPCVSYPGPARPSPIRHHRDSLRFRRKKRRRFRAFGGDVGLRGSPRYCSAASAVAGGPRRPGPNVV